MDWSQVLLSGLLGGYVFSRVGVALTERWRGRRLPWVHGAAWLLTLAAHLVAARMRAPGLALSPTELALTAGALALVQAGWWMGDLGRERAGPKGPAGRP